MKQKQVIVVGAGIVGLSTAYYLNKMGAKVTVIDDTDGTNNCSYGNAGYISPSHIIPLASPGIINQGLKWMLNPESPFYIKPRLNKDLIRWGLLFKKASTEKRVLAAAPVLKELMTRSQTLYEEILSDESIEAGYHKPGLLMVCKTGQALKEERELVLLAQKLGLEAEVISKNEVEKLEPNVQYDIKGAVYFGCDAWMTPNAFMKHFKEVLLNRGVDICFDTMLKGFRKKRKSIESLHTSSGSMEADDYVLATGSWSPLITRQLGVNIPLQAGKGYSFMMEKPPVMSRLPSILVEGRLATTPMLHGLRFAGTMELTGLNLNVNQRKIDGIIKNIKAFMPQFREEDFSGIKPWAGLRPCSPDGLPYIGRTKKYDNLFIGTGHAMLGWTLGPVTGKLLAENILHSEFSNISPLLSVDRYN